jgi:hypothetical protein
MRRICPIHNIQYNALTSFCPRCTEIRENGKGGGGAGSSSSQGKTQSEGQTQNEGKSTNSTSRMLLYIIVLSLVCIILSVGITQLSFDNISYNDTYKLPITIELCDAPRA